MRVQLNGYCVGESLSRTTTYVRAQYVSCLRQASPYDRASTASMASPLPASLSRYSTHLLQVRVQILISGVDAKRVEPHHHRDVRVRPLDLRGRRHPRLLLKDRRRNARALPLLDGDHGELGERGDRFGSEAAARSGGVLLRAVDEGGDRVPAEGGEDAGRAGRGDGRSEKQEEEGE